MSPNGLSQSTVILLVTLGLSILVHAAVLMWGAGDINSATLPGQRLQVQVSVASEPVDTRVHDNMGEHLKEVDPPRPDPSQAGERATEKTSVTQLASTASQETTVQEYTAPLEGTQKSGPASESDVSVADSEATEAQVLLGSDQIVAKADKSLQTLKPEVQAEARLMAPNSVQADIPRADLSAHVNTATDGAKAQHASFQAAQVRQQAKPQYPRLARRRGQEGTVWLRVQVDAAGWAQTIAIERSSGFELLDKAALKAVRAWRFQPALRDGQAQASYVKIPVKFQLDTPQ